MAEQWNVSEFLLGVEGLALLRNWLGDPRAGRQRVREIEELCRRFASPRSDDVLEIEEVGVAGYEQLAPDYDQIDNPLIKAEEGPVRQLVDTLPQGRVVDVACGTGRYTKYLLERGHSVTGIDASEAMLGEAKKKVPEATLIRGLADTLPLRDASFDSAVCALALTHLPEIHRPIAELARVVRPNGSIIISDIHPLPAATGAHVLVGLSGGKLGLIRDYSHPHSRYIGAFVDAGLEIRACIEPPFIADYAGGPLAEVPEATAMAMEGLPLALIWHLTR